MSKYHSETVKLYAAALFDYALESGSLNSLAKEIESLDSILANNSEIVENISAPIYLKQQQDSLISKISEALKLSSPLTNLLKILAENQKLGLIVDILQVFQALFLKRSGKKIVTVTLAHPLNEKENEKLQVLLEEKLLTKVIMECEINPKILGGVIVKVDGKMLDASLLTKLKHLDKDVEKEIALM